MSSVKIAAMLMLSLMLPQVFMGLYSINYDYGDQTKNNVNSHTIVESNTASIPLEKEEYLLDVQWPVNNYEQRTSHFGYRWLKGCSQCSTFHQGIDFTPGEGENIYNIMDGEIVDVGWDNSYGYRAVIRHTIYKDELEYTTIYAHMQPTAISEKYNTGDKVAKGALIGLVGNTGVSTGPHLHFEVHRNYKVLDPLLFLDKHITD